MWLITRRVELIYRKTGGLLLLGAEAMKRHSEAGRKKTRLTQRYCGSPEKDLDAQDVRLLAVTVTDAINTGIAARNMAAMVQNT